ncbi:MAG: amidase domain-containing protein [Firmicutes bacterium]|nr:amidase domain-containing protein [Bacillota bacterium]
MMLFIIVKKSTLVYVTIGIILLCALAAAAYHYIDDVSEAFSRDEILSVIQQMFDIRNKAILEKDSEVLKSLYDTKKRYGMWAYEHEVKKMKYLHQWSEKQGIRFTHIHSDITIRYIKEKGAGITANLIVSTTYRYQYKNETYGANDFRIGTYHSIDLVPKSGKTLEKHHQINEEVLLKQEEWIIVKEWYKDPFADSLHLDSIKSEDIKTHILSRGPRDFSEISVRRMAAVEYADQYCGAANDRQTGYQYNKKYKDYNPLGGDCANFASQILFEGGKFKKTRQWNYVKDGSKAWVNAHAFKSYMLYSGRASKIAYGTYNKVYKASYQLLPGDFIAYEKKGKVTHISVVTGADSKGYALVNCHNVDRYRVPWDLGWSDKGIKFWLVRVHY